jgi:hypothetical protein
MIETEAFCTPPEGDHDRGMRIARFSSRPICSESKSEVDAPDIAWVEGDGVVRLGSHGDVKWSRFNVHR